MSGPLRRTIPGPARCTPGYEGRPERTVQLLCRPAKRQWPAIDEKMDSRGLHGRQILCLGVLKRKGSPARTPAPNNASVSGLVDLVRKLARWVSARAYSSGGDEEPRQGVALHVSRSIDARILRVVSRDSLPEWTAPPCVRIAACGGAEASWVRLRNPRWKGQCNGVHGCIHSTVPV